MGWKLLRDTYRIGHTVAIYEGEGLCIGSAWVHDLIRVSNDGDVTWGSLGPARNDNLARYYNEMTADKAALVKLLNTPDTFTRSIPVYTYKGAEIIEKYCEDPGWPNVTHDGELMYANTHSIDKAKAVQWAKQNAQAGVELITSRIEELHADLAKKLARLTEEEGNLAKLQTDYPAVPITQ